MKRKVISVLLCAFLLLPLIPTAVFAENGVTDVGNYEELYDAVRRGDSNIRLTTDIAYNCPDDKGWVNVILNFSSGSTVIDLNNHTVEFRTFNTHQYHDKTFSFINLTGTASLTLKNGTITQYNQNADGRDSQGPIQVKDSATLTTQNVNVENSRRGYAIYAKDSSNIYLNGGTITAFDGFAVYTTGGVKLTLDGGVQLKLRAGGAGTPTQFANLGYGSLEMNNPTGADLRIINARFNAGVTIKDASIRQSAFNLATHTITIGSAKVTKPIYDGIAYDYITLPESDKANYCDIAVWDSDNLVPVQNASIYIGNVGVKEGALIPGTTGTGTEDDPVVVDTFYELRNAMQNLDVRYIRVGADIELYSDNDTEYNPSGCVISQVGTKYLQLDHDVTYLGTYIDGDTHPTQYLIMTNSNNLTLTGTGTLTGKFNRFSRAAYCSVIEGGGTTTIDGPTIIGDGNLITSYGLAVHKDSGKLVVISGTLKSHAFYPWATDNDMHVQYVDYPLFPAVELGGRATFDIRGGTLISSTDARQLTPEELSNSTRDYGLTISENVHAVALDVTDGPSGTITGGEFYNGIRVLERLPQNGAIVPYRTVPVDFSNYVDTAKYNIITEGNVTRIVSNLPALSTPAPILDPDGRAHWEAISGATGYEVVLKDQSMNIVTTINVSGTSCDLSAYMTDGKTYYCLVTALDATGTHAESAAGRSEWTTYYPGEFFGIWIGNKPVTSVNRYDVLNDGGSVQFLPNGEAYNEDLHGNTLVLNNLNLTKNPACHTNADGHRAMLTIANDIAVVLIGENVIHPPKNGNLYWEDDLGSLDGIYIGQNMCVSFFGDGSLDVSVSRNNSALFSDNSTVMLNDNVTMRLSGKYGFDSAYSGIEVPWLYIRDNAKLYAYGVRDENDREGLAIYCPEIKLNDNAYLYAEYEWNTQAVYTWESNYKESASTILNIRGIRNLPGIEKNTEWETLNSINTCPEDDEGKFRALEIQAGKPSVLFGDANGDGSVDSKDLSLLRKYMASYDYTTGTSTVAVKAGADANGDGTIDSKDLSLLRKYMAAYDYTTGTSTVVLGPSK